MKRKLIFFTIVGIIIILLLIRIFSGTGKKQSEAAAAVKPVVPVEVFIARDTSMVYQLSTIGSLRANESVEIVSEISKKIITVFLKEGSFVSQGQLLLKLDDAEIVARINKLTIEEKLASTNESRQKAQLAKGGISQEQYDETLNHLNMIRAEIEILKVDFSKTEIRAPFAGKIGVRNVSEGALVNPNMVLASLQDVSRIKIDFSIPERYAGDLHQGSGISFTTDYSTKVYKAVIEAVQPDVEKKTRTILLRALCENRDGSLVPGASVRVDLNLQALDKKLFIPTSALIPTVKGYDVYLMKSGKAVLQAVTTGIRNNLSVQIVNGLALNDTVVVTNLLRIKPESPLKLVKLN
ncbi:MAG: efflux RND transporter periplasmic adaptor subunit [Bacteroidetes bacterium]|nr:efflux RND transporter periplasmic adaptor subunit [Bacteroidota bacterium]